MKTRPPYRNGKLTIQLHAETLGHHVIAQRILDFLDQHLDHYDPTARHQTTTPHTTKPTHKHKITSLDHIPDEVAIDLNTAAALAAGYNVTVGRKHNIPKYHIPDVPKQYFDYTGHTVITALLLGLPYDTAAHLAHHCDRHSVTAHLLHIAAGGPTPDELPQHPRRHIARKLSHHLRHNPHTYSRDTDAAWAKGNVYGITMHSLDHMPDDLSLSLPYLVLLAAGCRVTVDADTVTTAVVPAPTDINIPQPGITAADILGIPTQHAHGLLLPNPHPHRQGTTANRYPALLDVIAYLDRTSGDHNPDRHGW